MIQATIHFKDTEVIGIHTKRLTLEIPDEQLLILRCPSKSKSDHCEANNSSNRKVDKETQQFRFCPEVVSLHVHI